ncbi:putative peptidoglycan binding protein [Anaerobacterium chartisolvens]|uniref:Putative peptidoglycan binding protein n=1 Tax=Anaerobacterium chartisolvens TaxID=1297424 RepID=A0A369BCU7_9FIRM|nr:peptidoglycan-binding domain-containing protein [Anaerobacterium chartisolvens]RCX17494.1 putative peptidoglycan binding protein [Anaerobacterium chartisolvens]
MPTVYVYNYASNAMETYVRGLTEAMPYSTENTLSVGEFRANSRANVIWTDRRTMEAWNVLRSAWGRSIYVGYAFKRIWEGGHTAQSQHYAGTALDMAQNLDPATRNRLRDVAINTGVWSYVEPAYLTPTWVHVDKRTGIPACAAGGYPLVASGSVGVYVLVLQDGLNALGYTGSGLDGYFGAGTRTAVMRFQAAQGLSADGIAGCNTWEALTTMAVGIGQTATVVDP